MTPPVSVDWMSGTENVGKVKITFAEEGVEYDLTLQKATVEYHQTHDKWWMDWNQGHSGTGGKVTGGKLEEIRDISSRMNQPGYVYVASVAVLSPDIDACASSDWVYSAV